MFNNFIKQKWMPSSKFVELNNFTDAINQFKSYFKGVVVYDPNVYSTSLVAETITGINDLLPVCGRDNGVVYTEIVTKGLFPIVTDLRNKFTGNVTGSKKNDAYIWAIGLNFN